MSAEMNVDLAKYKIKAKIEKYNTYKAYENKKVDEVLELPGNMLTNQGVNHLWKLVSNIDENGQAFSNSQSAPASGLSLAPFGTNSFIGVGNNFDEPSGTALATDEGLNAGRQNAQSSGTGSYMYMKLDNDGGITYPRAGVDQKIVYKATFLPGVACFNWYEWTIANGNGNPLTEDGFNDDEVRRNAKGDDAEPDPAPVAGVAYDYGKTEQNVINLNHKLESMGRKYAQATWIVTVEISLS